MIASSSPTLSLVSSLVLCLAVVAGLWLMVVWVVLPFMLNNHFKALIKQAEQTNALLSKLLAKAGNAEARASHRDAATGKKETNETNRTDRTYRI